MKGQCLIAITSFSNWFLVVFAFRRQIWAEIGRLMISMTWLFVYNLNHTLTRGISQEMLNQSLVFRSDWAGLEIGFGFEMNVVQANPKCKGAFLGLILFKKWG